MRLRKRSSLCILLTFFMVTTACFLGGQTALSAEPLRILVPLFEGHPAVSKVVSMTVYFEMIRAFRNSGAPERGAWILYGREEVRDASHGSITDAALWPSVWADVVVWGRVTRLGDGFVVEPYVTRTPISRIREVQPEVLVAHFRTSRNSYDLSLANSAMFFDLEPFAIAGSNVERYHDYIRGIPVYPGEHAPEPEAYTNDVVYFLEVKQNAARVYYEGRREGWIRFLELPREDLSIIHFGRGMIRILRGDWRGAIGSFSELVEFSTLPNALRMNAHIYLGIARYKLGQSGLDEFRRAFALNAFDKDAASFFLLGLLLEYSQNHDPNILAELNSTIANSQVLFSETDPWFSRLRRAVADFR